MKNIIVYGSRFGQFYLEALKRIKGIKIVGLLAKGSDRSYECARYYNIPLYTSLDEVEERVDVACVAVKTGALGGEGANIAKQLLRKGINVLLEQPVHYKELGECYKIAQNQKVYFGRSASDTSPMGECGKYMRSCALSDGNCKDWRYSNKFQST